MSQNEPINLDLILPRLETGNLTADDIACLKSWLTSGDNSSQVQLGKYVVNIEKVLGQVHIGDRTTLSDEQIQAIAQAIREQLPQPPETSELPAIDDLVQQVRSRFHDDIQRLHGTMPLWGVDHWVPLGELFVDVNILEGVSSNRRSELDDLWQDFSQNPGYRSLDRMGLCRERQRMSGLEVLERNTNLMVVGKPGSGKTTYLQRVVTECNVGNLQAHRIPVLIRVREFVEDGRSVDYAVERHLERCWRLSEVEVRLVLDGGRSLVLLDGLDEVTGADGQAIAKQIKRFARDYPQVQVIVTCRTQSQESRFDRFDYVEVADFNEPQVRAFTEHWFQAVGGDLTVGQTKATAFLDQLFWEENKAIQELAITPILLSLTCAVFQQKQAFYSKRSKLYEEGLELLLEQWDRSREIERDEVYRDLSVERKLELLSYLAVKKFEQEQYVLFEQAEIEGYIGEFLGIGGRESRGVLRAIESQHGLLIERSQKVWSFSHLTFQEYLVAKNFFDYSQWNNLVKQINNKYWQEVFLLVINNLHNADDLLQLIKQETDNIISINLKLQKFLIWVNEKVDSLTIFYKHQALRAFYFSFDRISSDQKELEYSELVASALDSDLARTISANRGLPFDLEFDLHLDITIATSSSIPSLENINRMTGFLKQKLAEKGLLVRDFDKNLGCELTALMNQLPEPSSSDYKFSDEPRETTKQWWNVIRPIWLRQLRLIGVEYRNIGHDWQLDTFDRKLKQEYYDGNKLLTLCLNGSIAIPYRVRYT